MARFGAVLTAMVTPFGDDGSLDLEAAAQVARWLVNHGNEGLVLAGTTGESPTLSDDDRVALFEAVRAAVDVPLVVGSTTNDTRHSVRLTERVAGCGIDGILAVTPYYNRPSQAGLEAHFRAIAEATDLPVMLYDVPLRTGRKVATETMLRLARTSPNVVALKDAGGNPGETARLVADAPASFEVYSGDDTSTLPLLAVGAVGVVGVATHWTARHTAQMIAAFEAGDVAEARRINAELLPSYAFETGDGAPNPIPTKALMRQLGLPVGPCRLPMGPDPDWLEAAARKVISQLGLASE